MGSTNSIEQQVLAAARRLKEWTVAVCGALAFEGVALESARVGREGDGFSLVAARMKPGANVPWVLLQKYIDGIYEWECWQTSRCFIISR